jgi:hypothetical protein
MPSVAVRTSGTAPTFTMPGASAVPPPGPATGTA